MTFNHRRFLAAGAQVIFPPGFANMPISPDDFNNYVIHDDLASQNGYKLWLHYNPRWSSSSYEIYEPGSGKKVQVYGTFEQVIEKFNLVISGTATMEEVSLCCKKGGHE